MKALEIIEYFGAEEMVNNNTPFEEQDYAEAIKELEELENRSCQNCSTHPSNCRIFYGANKQLALSVETFNCSLWEAKK